MIWIYEKKLAFEGMLARPFHSLSHKVVSKFQEESCNVIFWAIAKSTWCIVQKKKLLKIWENNLSTLKIWDNIFSVSSSSITSNGYGGQFFHEILIITFCDNVEWSTTTTTISKLYDAKKENSWLISMKINDI